MGVGGAGSLTRDEPAVKMAAIFEMLAKPLSSLLSSVPTAACSPHDEGSNALLTPFPSAMRSNRPAANRDLTLPFLSTNKICKLQRDLKGSSRSAAIRNRKSASTHQSMCGILDMSCGAPFGTSGSGIMGAWAKACSKPALTDPSPPEASLCWNAVVIRRRPCLCLRMQFSERHSDAGRRALNRESSMRGGRSKSNKNPRFFSSTDFEFALMHASLCGARSALNCSLSHRSAGQTAWASRMQSSRPASTACGGSRRQGRRQSPEYPPAAHERPEHAAGCHGAMAALSSSFRA